MVLPDIDYSGAEILYFREYDWWDYTRGIREVDLEAGRVTVDNAAMLSRGTRYYIFNAYGLLDAPGEFYVSRDDGYLYYWPEEADNSEPIQVEAAVTPGILVFGEHGGHSPARHMTFEGLELTVSAGTILTYRDAYDVEVKHSRLAGSEHDGVVITGTSRDNLIYGTLIENIGASGIRVEGPPGEVVYNVISSNIIRHCGQLSNGISGVYTLSGSYNLVSNNRIYNTTRYGASTKSDRSEGNIFAYNEISNVNTNTQDTGLMEAWHTSGHYIINNRLYSSSTPFGLSFGIYLDERCYDFVVVSNIVHSIVSNEDHTLTSAIYVKGERNTIDSNILANNDVQFAVILEGNDGGVASRNIIYDSGDSLFRGSTSELEEAVDNIVFGRPVSRWGVIRGGSPGTALVADPGFVEMVIGAFSLEPDSIAYDRGFLPPDLSRIGVRDDHRFLDTMDPEDSMFVGSPLPVEGVVVDARTGEPIGGARIESMAETTISDQKGRFSIAVAPDRPETRIRVSGDGYVPRSVPAPRLTQDGGMRGVIPLYADAPGLITGYVHYLPDLWAVPLADVSVFLEGEPVAVSTARGTFSIEDVEGSTGVLTFVRDGFEDVEVMLECGTDSGAFVQVEMVTEHSFDFGVAPDRSGFYRGLSRELCIPSRGYGWMTRTFAALRPDRRFEPYSSEPYGRSVLLMASGDSFRLDLPDGDYLLSVGVGDLSATEQENTVELEGTPLMEETGSMRALIEYPVQVSDGSVELHFGAKTRLAWVVVRRVE